MRKLWFDASLPLLSLILNVYTMRLSATRVVDDAAETLGGVAVNSTEAPSVVVTTSTAPEGGSVVGARSMMTTPYGSV